VKAGAAEQAFSFSALHHTAAERYAPPSVLVSEDYDIVHMSDRAGRFLQFAGGEPSRNLLKTAHPALKLDLRAALMTAKQDNRQAEFRNIKIPFDDGERQVNVIVRPVEIPDSQARYFLVVFNDERQSMPEEGTDAVFAALGGDAALESVVHRLEEELQQMRERLRSPSSRAKFPPRNSRPRTKSSRPSTKNCAQRPRSSKRARRSCNR